MQSKKTAKTKSELKLGLLAAFLIVIAFVTMISTVDKQSCDEVYKKDITIVSGELMLDAEVADSPMTRQQGLSGRTCIPENTAMLFVFEEAGLQSIWMKDMNFPIDIIWLDTAKKVVSIETDVLPESYPSIFYPDEIALYVIEAQAGFVSNNSITVGQQLSW